MKKIAIYFLLFFMIWHTPCLTTNTAEKYVIGPWPGGFGASFYAVLNHIRYCELTNKMPVVYWGSGCLYFSPEGLNGVRHNAWEYYFEPVSDLCYVTGKVNVYYPSHKDRYFCHDLKEEKRHEAFQLIQKYIKIKPAVQNKIDRFYQAHMEGKKTIGVHLRGTDKYREEPPIAPEVIIDEVLKYGDSDTQFFIASDERKLFARMKTLLQARGKKVIYYDCYRSSDGKALHIHDLPVPREKPSYAQLGEDVLVEILLLSKCDLLVHTYSNVSGNALYWNPELKNVLFWKNKIIKNW